MSNDDGGTDDIGAAVRALWDLTLHLRKECPWDQVQTAATIAPYTIEETYEVVDAVRAAQAAADGSSGTDEVGQLSNALHELEDELGDLLFQVMFLAMWCKEHENSIDVGSVARGIHSKLVRRHPHVFGEAAQLENADDVRGAWERIKREKEGKTDLFDGIPQSMPSVGRAFKLQKRAGSVGFDFQSAEKALDKLEEEVAELREAIAHASRTSGVSASEDAPPDERIASELGDVLFAAVNVARLAHVSPEVALGSTNHSFQQRVEGAVELAERDGVVFSSLDLDGQESYYQQAKKLLSN